LLPWNLLVIEIVQFAIMADDQAQQAQAGQARARWATYLTTTLGFPEDLKEAIVAQGYTSFETFDDMKDEDVDRLCSAMRKPGGTVVNPPAAGARGNAQAVVANPGVNVGDRFARRLKQLAYFLRYIKKIQRPIRVEHMGADQLQRLWTYKEQEEARDENPAFPEKYTTSKNARETIENMMEWIEASYGVEEIPLSYIIRDRVDPDEPPGDNDEYPVGRPTFEQELIRRAEHGNETYHMNNKKIWKMVRHVTHGTDAWSFVKAFNRNRDGRSAIFALKSQYMGGEFVNKVKIEADTQLETIFWSGKARNFTWDQFTSRLTSAFEDLAQFGEPKSDEEKVRRLLRAIRDPALSSAVVVVRSQALYSQNYQNAVDFLGGEVSRNTNEARIHRGISAVNRDGRGHGGYGRGGDGSNLGGRGRNSGRGGRGRGRGRGSPSRGQGGGGGRFSHNGYMLNNGTYPGNVWHSFKPEEKAYVNKLREEKDNANKRSVSALNTGNDEKRQKTEEENSQHRQGAAMSRPGAKP
jgi:hypothetical protein